MVQAGKGAIVVTGNTSALRGRPNFAGFAPTKAAQRILAEAMARKGARVTGLDLASELLQVAELHALEGREAEVAGETDAPPPDRGRVFGRP